jgi:uncharacterized repeat protein (TIGR03803 family)
MGIFAGRLDHLAARATLTAVLLMSARLVSAQVTFETLHTFTSASGLGPSALIQGADGNFYGTAAAGGAVGFGTVYRMTPSGTVTVLHEFAGGSGDGNAPQSLIQWTDGNFYGTTQFGGSAAGRGTVFRMTPGGSVTILHAFAGGTSDGANPVAALIAAADGNFYGTTPYGGAADNGTVFRLTPAGTFTILHSFVRTGPSADGAAPLGALVQGVDGNFYGTTSGGGASDGGTVFKMSPDGIITTLHVFTIAPTDGRVPVAGMIRGTDGNFYGTTFGGGDTNAGTIFRITPAGTFTVLHSFDATLDGSNPAASLIQGTDGNFYGTALYGTASRNGSVFQITPGGDWDILHTFTGIGSARALIQATDGRFYGTGAGIAFRFSFTPQMPAFVTQPLSQSVKAGRRVQFTVRASGPPAPGFQWQVSSNSGGSWTTLADDGAYSGTRTPKLIVTSANWTFDGYQFRAVATNSAGSATSSVAMVTVRAEGVTDVDGDVKADLVVFRPVGGNWFTRNSTTGYATSSTRQWGISGDVPVTGDYDGDGTADLAVWRPSSATWHILTSSSGFSTSFGFPWGFPSDLPVPGDYDGDGKTDPAVYRPSTGVWYVLTSSNNYSRDAPMLIQLGVANDIPAAADYDGDGKTDAAVFRPSTGIWYIRQSIGSAATSLIVRWGLGGDIPVAADYDADGKADIAVFRPAAGTWYILQSTTNFTTSVSFQWGVRSDIPAPTDFDGDGQTDLAVFRPTSGTWFIRQSTTHYATSVSFQWGLDGDVPAPNAPIANAVATAGSRPSTSTLANLTRGTDFNRDAKADITLYRPSDNSWSSATISFSGFPYTGLVRSVPTGLSGDIPVAGDYNGDGTSDLAVYQSSTGTWNILNSSLPVGGSSGFSLRPVQVAYQWGIDADLPVPGDYDGDGRTDPAVYRPANGVWYLLRSSTNFTTSAAVQWGLPGDVPVPGDYDGDGVTDVAVYRPSTGVWYLLKSSTGFTTFTAQQWGLANDITVPGDYDGDGKTDLAVYRPSTHIWYILHSSTSFASSATYDFGLSGDIPAPGDYDGDGRTDVVLWRPANSTWYFLRSSTGFTVWAAIGFGALGDLPILERVQ